MIVGQVPTQVTHLEHAAYEYVRTYDASKCYDKRLDGVLD